MERISDASFDEFYTKITSNARIHRSSKVGFTASGTARNEASDSLSSSVHSRISEEELDSGGGHIYYNSRRSRRFNVESSSGYGTPSHEDTGPTIAKLGVEIFIQTLHEARCQPFNLVETPIPCGEGGQFSVFKQRVAIPRRVGFHTMPVAIKRPKFPDSNDGDVNLSDRRAERCLFHAYLEITALMRPELTEHPNIVKLIGYALEDYRRQHTPVLVMDLAVSDLYRYLIDEAPVSYGVRRDLCADIAAGLDVIHQHNISHSDLKPENVLLFSEKGRLIAKLSDFGFATNDSLVSFQGGTPSWQAPEIRRHEVHDIFGLCLADNYSYGLMLWSVFLLEGHPPPSSNRASQQELAMKTFAEHRLLSLEAFYPSLIDTVFELLNLEPRIRPSILRQTKFLQGTTLDDTLMETSSRSDSPLSDTLYPRFEWEIQEVSGGFTESFLQWIKGSRPSDGSLSGNIVFSVFLGYLRRFSKIDNMHEETSLIALEASAKDFFPVAEGVIWRIFRFFNVKIPKWVEDDRQGLLQNAISTGSIQARQELQVISRSAMEHALADFRNRSGYFSLYLDQYGPLPKLMVEQIGGGDIDPDFTDLHWMSAYGSLEDMSHYLRSHGNHEINHRCVNLMTPLFIACMRGFRALVELLLSYGAKPSVNCTHLEISCLHWLFNFDEDDQESVATTLLDGGCNVDQCVAEDIPFPHYPFVLPAGSPLHWAAALSSNQTVQVLLNHGASPSVRNGVNACIFDETFKYQTHFLGINGERFSSPESLCKGLTPLDVAALERDGNIFQHMKNIRLTVDMNLGDEKGLAAIHWLASGSMRLTSQRIPFYSRPFQTNHGPRALEEIVATMQLLGADIDLLTGNSFDGKNYTPIMLAFLREDMELVKALSECGADLHKTNNIGETILFQIPHDLENESKLLDCMIYLVSQGVDARHRSNDKWTVLGIAAAGRHLKIFDYLIGLGLDIEERATEEITGKPDTPILQYLAREEDTNTLDQAVASILERRVFDMQDSQKTQRVVTQTDLDGKTLLHCFAGCAMVRCVELVLQNGALVNAERMEFTTVERNNQPFKKSWSLTPLDDAIKSVEDRKRQMLESQMHSDSETEALLEKYDKIVRLITDNGGVRATSAFAEQPVDFRASDYRRPGAYVSYLRHL